MFIIHVNAVLMLLLSESVARPPQATRPNMIAAVTPKTTQSVRGRSMKAGTSVEWRPGDEPPLPFSVSVDTGFGAD
ncbi:hypothetical protein GCM10010470_65910 [Saccharopolyspora taberi]|uniref:Secreted protein n=1 Tax=Saccharopolyspora taberi TaxID=60895 RepID=A0ABN3VN20_9PSEU